MADPVRVLILIKGLGLGGAETLVAQSAPVWDTDRFEYRVAYMLPWKDHLVPALESHQVKTVDLGWKGLGRAAAIRRLRDLVRDWQPDVIHSHLPAAGILARLVIDKTHVYTEHNDVSFYRRVTRGLNRVTYSRNAAVIAVSQAVADSVEGYPGPTPDVVPNGIAPPNPSRTAEDIREELGIRPETKLIVHVGNIRPHKGQGNLVAAVGRLADSRRDFLAISIGSEKFPGDIDRLESLAGDLGVGDRIRFLGQRKDAISFVAASDIFVNPADVEGLPLSVLEAMALQRPVVATSVGGVPTVVDDHRTGLLVAPGDPDALAAALEEALESKEASKWGVEAAKTVLDSHGVSRMVRAYEAIYDRVLA